MQLISFYNEYIGRVVAALTIVIAVSVFLYGIFLFGAVAHAAGRSKAEASVRSLEGKVSSLEGRFLTQTKELSPQKAAELGFVQPASVATVYAHPAGGLTLR